MELEEWLAHERQGTVESSGRFTLDVSKARVKLARFLLEDGLYLAKLVQAGVAAGCRKIDIKLDGDFTIRLAEPDLRAFDLGALAHALEEPQSLPPDSACACLATGMLAAQGRTSRSLKWQCSDGARIEIGTGGPGGEVRLSQTGPAPGPAWAILSVANVGDCAPERRALRERCGYCPIPIFVNGEAISHGWSEELLDQLSPVFRLAEKYWGGEALGLKLLAGDPSRACLHLRDGGEPWDCAVTLSSNLTETPLVRWVRLGVVVSTEELPGAPPGTVAVTTAMPLQTDLSQFKVKADENYALLTEKLYQRVEQVFTEVCANQKLLKVPAREGIMEGAVHVGLGTFGASLVVAFVAAFVAPDLAPLWILAASAGSLATSTGYYLYKEGRSDAAQEKRVRKLLRRLMDSRS